MNVTAAPPPVETTPNGSFILPTANAGHVVCVSSSMLAKVYSSGWLSDDSPTDNCMSLLMVQIPIIIFASKAVHLLLRPLNQPRFVCDVITGLILGKSGLGASDWFWDFIAPNKCGLVDKTLSVYGLMFYLFLAGVKANPGLVAQSGKTAALVGTVSQLFSFTVVNCLQRFTGGLSDSEAILRSKFFIFLGASISTTAAPVVGDTLADLRILDTELGRLGMSSAIVSDVFGWFFWGLFLGFNQSQVSHTAEVYALLSLLGMTTFIACVLAPYMRHIVRLTPPGGKVRESHLVAVIILVMVVSFTSDAIGASFMVGSLMFGLFVPHGPPLGTALVERLEVMGEEILLPLMLTSGTGVVDVWSLKSFSRWSELQFIVLAGYCAKVLGTVLPAVCCKVPPLDAFLLGLIMNFRGIVEMITYIRFRRGTLLDVESYTIMMLSSAAVSAVAAFLVGKLYNPLKSMARPVTIQKLGASEEFRMLVCVHTKSHVSTILELVEASFSPLCAYVLHIVDLAGRTSSAVIAHRNKKGFISPEGMSSVFDPFIKYEQDNRGQIFTVQPFTAVVPFKSMHRDILSMASQKHVALILLPFLRGDAPRKPTKAELAMRSITPEILLHAPCSVGILVHRGVCGPLNPSPSIFQRRIAVFFWGGPDDREALMYAARMARHPSVSVTIMRFMPNPTDIEWRNEDEMVLGGFKILNAGNDRVVVEEIRVKDLEETFAVFRSNGYKYDLLVVGRQQEGALLFEEGLAEFCEFPYLGVVGDMLASSDFKCSCSVLVIQQHQPHSELKGNQCSLYI